MEIQIPEKVLQQTPAQRSEVMYNAALLGEIEIHYWESAKSGIVLELPVEIGVEVPDLSDTEKQRLDYKYGDTKYMGVMTKDKLEYIHAFLVDILG